MCSTAKDKNSIAEYCEKAKNISIVKLEQSWQSSSISGCIVVSLGGQKSYTLNLVMLQLTPPPSRTPPGRTLDAPPYRSTLGIPTSR
jgi:hypothetical protein